jgi:hypothetical protein
VFCQEKRKTGVSEILLKSGHFYIEIKNKLHLKPHDLNMHRVQLLVAVASRDLEAFFFIELCKLGTG